MSLCQRPPVLSKYLLIETYFLVLKVVLRVRLGCDWEGKSMNEYGILVGLPITIYQQSGI